MCSSMRNVLRLAVVVAMLVVPLTALIAATSFLGELLYAADQAVVAEPAPPEGQTYTGSKKCASCHFEQFTFWKKTKHAVAFEALTAKYQKDPTCLKCHTTGYGQPTGFKDMATTPALAGNTCENCHGPGSKHEEMCTGYANKKLTPEEEKIAKDSIWLMLPKNVCVECHVVIGHKPNPTPPELQPKK